MILTPFYPINHRDDLFEDTKSIFNLLKSFSDDNLLIIHSFNHHYISAFKNLRKILVKERNYNDYLYTDGYGNDLFFFENLFLIPKIPQGLKFMDEKYANIVKKYYNKKNITPDAIITHLPTYYSIFLKELNIVDNSIAIIHSSDLINIKKRKNLDYWKKYFNSFDAIGFRSHMIKNEFKDTLKIDNNTFMCFSGIPKEYIDFNINEKKINKNDNLKLLFAGRLVKNKNVISILKTLNKIKDDFDFKLHILGEGNERNKLENFTKKNKLDKKVLFRGKVSRNKTFKEMIDSDIFIMLSKKETLGLVYLEAMAAGCIVIATKGQGIDGIIKDGINGFLVQHDDIEAITNKIRIAKNLTLKERKKIMKNAKKTVSKFSDQEVSIAYKKNIHAVINRNRN